MNAIKKTRIAIIEPSPVIRQGIKSLLKDHPEFEIANMYADLQAFQDGRQKPTFDMILINPAIVSFYKQFNVRNLFPNYSGVIIAILYGYADAQTLDSFDGTLDIYDDGGKMAKKLHRVREKFTEQPNGNSSDSVELSDREKEILISVAKGMSNKEIADKHFISVHTVMSHRKNITRKTGIKTVSGLTVYALFNNLVSQEELKN